MTAPTEMPPAAAEAAVDETTSLPVVAVARLDETPSRVFTPEYSLIARKRYVTEVPNVTVTVSLPPEVLA